MSDEIRVLLADDHTLVRAGVRRLLEAHPRIRVVAEASSGDEALEALARQKVDVVVLDLSMPGRDGLALLAEMRARGGGPHAIVLTMHADPAFVTRAVREGARGYLLKDSAAQDLTAAIEAVMAGEAYYSPAVQQVLAGAMRGGRSPIEDLTDREREVLRLVARGMPTKQIAAELEISGRTVETHRANIMRKLDARSIAVLTQIAIREGLLGRE